MVRPQPDMVATTTCIDPERKSLASGTSAFAGSSDTRLRPGKQITEGRRRTSRRAGYWGPLVQQVSVQITIEAHRPRGRWAFFFLVAELAKSDESTELNSAASTAIDVRIGPPFSELLRARKRLKYDAPELPAQRQDLYVQCESVLTTSASTGPPRPNR